MHGELGRLCDEADGQEGISLTRGDSGSGNAFRQCAGMCIFGITCCSCGPEQLQVCFCTTMVMLLFVHFVLKKKSSAKLSWEPTIPPNVILLLLFPCLLFFFEVVMRFFSSFDKDQLELAGKWSLYVAKVPASHRHYFGNTGGKYKRFACID